MRVVPRDRRPSNALRRHSSLLSPSSAPLPSRALRLPRLPLCPRRSTPRFQHKPKAPTDKVDLQLEDADLGELVRVIGELTGKRFVIASPKLAKTKASVYAPQKVTVAEAYQAFLAVLTANGLTVVPQAGFLKIVESQDVARQLTPIERGDIPAEERYVTRIHRLAHLSAEEVASGVLSKLATKDASIVPYVAGNLLIITETGANLRRMLEVLDAIDAASEEDKLYLQPLRYLPASVGGEAADARSSISRRRRAPRRRARSTSGASSPSSDRTRSSSSRRAAPTSGSCACSSRSTSRRRTRRRCASSCSSTPMPKKIVGPINEAIGGPSAGAGGGATQRRSQRRAAERAGRGARGQPPR